MTLCVFVFIITILKRMNWRHWIKRKKTVYLLKSKFQLICRSQCHPKIQSIGETQQKPGWPSPIHPLIPLMPQSALRRNVPATNQVPIHPRKQDLSKLDLSEIPSLDPKIQSLLQHKPKYQTNGESQQNPKFQFFGDNQPGPKFQHLLQPMIPQLQLILEIPCSNPSPTPSTNFTGRRIVVMFWIVLSTKPGLVWPECIHNG